MAYNVELTDYATHCKDAVFYGIKPLTDAEILQMHSHGLTSLAAAMSIASDLQAGFTFEEAAEAFKRSGDQ